MEGYPLARPPDPSAPGRLRPRPSMSPSPLRSCCRPLFLPGSSSPPRAPNLQRLPLLIAAQRGHRRGGEGMADCPGVVHVYMHLDCENYETCISTLRQQLANHPQHEGNIDKYGDWITEHPLLPEQTAGLPKRWMHVHFIMKGTRKTTLAIRGDNVYVIGFSNESDKWYELGREKYDVRFITGSTFLGCGLRYGSLLAGDSENGSAKLLDEVVLGKRCAEEAVHHLSSYNAGPGVQAVRETKRHLVCLILMISEATRMFPHYERVIAGWITDIILKDPKDPQDRLVKYLRNWESISNAMMKREGYSKTLEHIGITDQESAFRVVYLMLNSMTRKTKKNQLSSPAGQGNGPKGGQGDNSGQGGKDGGGGKGGHGRKPKEKKPQPRPNQGSPQQQDEEEPPLTSAEESQPQQHNEEPLPIPTGQAPDPLHRESDEEDYDVNSNGNDDEEDDELADLGQLLVEVFSVRASSGLVDTIAVFDGKRGQIIYSHDGERDAGIDSQRNLQLTGPYEAISADGRVAIQVSSLTAAADASDQSSNVYWATLWDGYADDAVYDELITKSITTATSGNTETEVTYAVLTNAVEATVQVQLKLSTVTADSTRFHGQITAKIQHFDGESILFSRHGGEELELFPSSDGLIIPFPLARSVVAVPLYSSLSINVKLHAACPPNHEDMVFFEKNLVFDPCAISMEDIERSGVIVQVTITSEDIQPLQGQSNRTLPAAPSASTPSQPMTSVRDDPAHNVLNTTTGKDVTPSVSASKDMLKKATTSEVVDEAKSESLSSGVTQNYQDGAKASLDPQTARDKTTKTKTIQPLKQIIDDDAVGAILCMDAHQTKPLIVTGHEFGRVKIWNYETQQKVVASIKVSREAMHTVKFVARKRWVVAVSADCFLHVYKYEKELEKVTSFKVHDYLDGGCYSLDVHPTQPYVLSGCGTEIRLWDWDQDWNYIQTFEEHSDDINELKFNPEDTNSFASASDDRTVKVWSLDSPKSKYTLSGHSDYVYCLDFFKRDGQQYLISGSRDNTAKIWDLQKKGCVHTLEHESDVYYVFAHPSLPVLIAGGDDGAVLVWSSTDFRLKTKFGVNASVFGFACLTGSERVAVAYSDGVSVMEIGDEEGQGGSEGRNENSISAIDY